MSTTFFIRVDGEKVKLVHRYGGGNGSLCYSVRNPLLPMLKPDVEVENDNSDTEIKTVGDLQKKIKENNGI